MRRVRLSRAYTEEGTFGILMIDDVPICVTLEKPWVNNIPTISCIPESEYRCELRQSPKFGRTYEVKSVPGRKYILFHKGNTVGDTSGCIILGLYFVHQNKEATLRNSQNAYDRFMRRLGGKPFTLIVEGEVGSKVVVL